MKPTFPLSIVLVLTLSWGAANAQPAVDSADLAQVYQHALAEDAELREAEARYRAALEAQPLARSAQRPNVNAEAGTSVFFVDPSGAPSADGLRFNLGLVLNQSLFDRRTQVGLVQADLQVALAAAELDAARQDLMLRVAETYFNVLTATEILEFRRTEREAIARQMDQTQRRFEVGLVAITDVKEAQARLDFATAEEISAERNLDVAREALAVLTNRHYGRLASRQANIQKQNPEPADIEQWVAMALENNQGLQMRRLGAEIAREQIARQRAEGDPTVGLNAALTDTRYSGVNGPQFNDSTDARIALQLNVPLYTGGRVQALTRQAREEFDAAQEAVTLAERRTTQNARSSYLSVLANAARAQALEQAVASNQAALESTEAGFQVGTRTQVDVLLALREVFRAESDFAAATYAYLVDLLRLQRAVGGLSVESLDHINRFLD